MIRTKFNMLGINLQGIQEEEFVITDPTKIIYETKQASTVIPGLNAACSIDWGDGTIESKTGSTSTYTYTHTYTDGIESHIIYVDPKSATQLMGSSSTQNNMSKVYNVPSTITKMSAYLFGTTYTNKGKYSNVQLEFADLSNSGITAATAACFLGCTNVKEIRLPNGLLTIAQQSFAYTTNLKKMVIPDTVTTILTNPLAITSPGTFAYSGLKSLNIPKNVKSIGLNTSTIGGNIFGCSEITELSIDPANTYYEMIGDALVQKSTKKVIGVKPGISIDFTLPIYNSLTGIAYRGLNLHNYRENNPNVTITLSSKLTSIGNYAFQYLNIYGTFDIPYGVTSLGIYIFQYCPNITSITIPSSVTTISQGMCHSCTELTSINIPSSVTTIGSYAFQSCTGLTSIDIPNSVTTIGDGAFNCCIGLTSIDIPSSVTTIGSYAFQSCTNLTSLTFQGKTLDQVQAMTNYPWGITNTSIINVS